MRCYAPDGQVVIETGASWQADAREPQSVELSCGGWRVTTVFSQTDEWADAVREEGAWSDAVLGPDGRPEPVGEQAPAAGVAVRWLIRVPEGWLLVLRGTTPAPAVQVVDWPAG